MFHALLEFASCPPSRGRPRTIPENRVRDTSLDENQGPSQLHGHGPWLVCEVFPWQGHGVGHVLTKPRFRPNWQSSMLQPMLHFPQTTRHRRPPHRHFSGTLIGCL